MNNMNLNPVNAAAQSMATPAESAQGLASLGRNNDSMLMHVTPNEVQGLQQLAQNMGGSLTRNPATGLPEAGFFDFLGNMLPTIAGIGLTATGMGPLAAGLTAGAGTAAITGDLGKGIMAGFGAYGGGNLAEGLSNAGSATQLTPGLTDAAGASMEGMIPNVASPGNFIDPAYAPTVGVPAVDPASITTMSAPADVTFGNMAQGLENITAPGGFDVLKQSMGTEGAPLTSGQAAFKVASPFAMPVLGAMAPPPMSMEEEDSGFGPFKSIAERRRENNPMMLAGGGPILEDGTGLAGLLDKRVGNEGETNGTAQYYAAGGPTSIDEWREYYKDPMAFEERMSDTAASEKAANAVSQPAMFKQMLQPSGIGMLGQMQQPTGMGMMANLNSPAISANAGPAVSTGVDDYRRQYAGMAKGGYLDGPGDGMSDDIHATIEGKQPARLADGEFVVPADVVSHLGNGSTKAGAKHLYAMMDKVRHARTGTKKQGKQIKADKYLPA